MAKGSSLNGKDALKEIKRGTSRRKRKFNKQKCGYINRLPCSWVLQIMFDGWSKNHSTVWCASKCV